MAITFSTSPDSTAVQFLEPVQTAGERHPYLFTQCQAIHARSFVPCQVCRLCSPEHLWSQVCAPGGAYISQAPDGSCRVPSLADRPREGLHLPDFGLLQLYLALQTAGGPQVQRPPSWVALGVLHKLVLVQQYQA